MTAFLARSLAGLAGLLLALAAGASEYSVSPMRMQLDRETRSTVLTLTNDGADRIEFQVSVMEWTQDADGKDVYSETRDIVLFPRIFAVEPNERRVVRVGVKAIPAATERAYRLFVEKIPTASPASVVPGAHVAINFRFALPLFVKPASPREERAEIVEAAVRKGELRLVLRNAGNEHFRMDEGIRVAGRDARGEQIAAFDIDDRYLLAGATKRYTAAIPRDACRRLASLELVAPTERFTLDRRIELDPTSCE